MSELQDLPHLEETLIVPDEIHDYNPFRGGQVPIVIDNGAYQCRVGFATESHPTLVFRNLIAKLRNKKEHELLVGNNITSLEAVKWLLRSPFDNNVITQFDVQETIFDHIFTHLGVDTQSVEHPIVMNEAACIPIYSRSMIDELFFECYQVPSVLFGVDSLFSLHHNQPDMKDCLIISIGHHTTHILPLVDGRLCQEATSRINLGGFNLTLYMQRLMQLKYPKHSQEFTFSKCENLVQRECFFSSDYDMEVSNWSNETYKNENVKKFRSIKTLPSSLTSDQLAMRDNFDLVCDHLLNKVNTNLSKKREKQLIDYEEMRKRFKTLQELIEEEELADPALIAKAFHHAGVKNLNELKVKLSEVMQEIKLIKHKLNPKQEQETNVIDELRTFQKTNNCSEDEWLAYVREIRRTRIGENAWMLNELLREYDVERKRIKSSGHNENMIEIESEMIRVPELIFAPNALINYQQCGISESLENVIKKLGRPELSENIFITGGCANMKGLYERIEKEATSLRPFKSPLKITIAENPCLDAWKGARECANTLTEKFITKENYYEMGPSYINEYKCSNFNLCT